uniref:Uncharacterized protein n=1 Tax=Lepeophtheirus salmonis TaxID=72036 RepID=A0A0K2UL92_LEPSM
MSGCMFSQNLPVLPSSRYGTLN